MMFLLFFGQVAAFDNKISSKFLLESDPTPSKIEVIIFLVAVLLSRHLSTYNSNSFYLLGFEGVLLGGSAWYSSTILQVTANTR